MEGCSVVFHLAALIAIPFSYHSPDSYVDTNIKGTLNAAAARHLGTERVPLPRRPRCTERPNMRRSTKHPSKANLPTVRQNRSRPHRESFYRSFQTPVVIVRPFNTYGPRQSARAVIPTIITQLLDGETQLRLGSLEPTRDFNYGADTVRGFVALAEADGAVGEEVNIATGVEHSIGEIADLLIREINQGAAVVVEDDRLRPENSEVYRLVGDSRRSPGSRAGLRSSICAQASRKP
jgi:nucleoside-diphosphate-sugar epimerase